MLADGYPCLHLCKAENVTSYQMPAKLRSPASKMLTTGYHLPAMQPVNVQAAAALAWIRPHRCLARA